MNYFNNLNNFDCFGKQNFCQNSGCGFNQMPFQNFQPSFNRGCFSNFSPCTIALIFALCGCGCKRW